MSGLRRHPHREGFVLILVLAILVALTVLAGTVALVTQRLRDDQLERQREWRADLDMADTRASVIYLLLTQRMTMGGLTVDDTVRLTPDEQAEARLTGEIPLTAAPVGNEIRLDSSAHRGLGSVDFALQDDRGLLSFNWSPTPFLAERMRLWDSGIGWSRLASLLLDYQDPDDLYRLNSAERAQYLEAGLAPPSNRALTTPLQIRAVLGWREALAGVDDVTLTQTFTVDRTALLNLNTAPATVLESIPGIDADAARRIVDARRLQPYTLLRQVIQQVPGLDFEESELFSLFPASSGTLRLWSREGGQARVLHWTLTPNKEGGAPWREDYEYTLSKDGFGAELGARIAATPVLAEPVSAAQ
jgi:hypothetical protein